MEAARRRDKSPQTQRPALYRAGFGPAGTCTGEEAVPGKPPPLGFLSRPAIEGFFSWTAAEGIGRPFGQGGDSPIPWARRHLKATLLLPATRNMLLGPVKAE